MSGKALIVLEDGTVFEGVSFGAEGEKFGELVFNTGMTGYQEILTDPSYKGQIVTMTYPLIGNYGINDEDAESGSIKVEGLIVREQCITPSNWKKVMTIQEYLKKYNVIGVQGVDTRAIVRHIRIIGAIKSVVSTIDHDVNSLLKKVRAWEGLDGVDLVKEVTCDKLYTVGESDAKYHVAALDVGMKNNIVRELVAAGCRVTVLPAYTTADEVMGLNPDGIFLSNGPGDPRPLHSIIDTCKTLMGKKPMFGICLGHEIIGLALGARISHMKFGHRGVNQPIKELKSGRVLITSENHGWAIDKDSIPDCVEITRINLNDGTVEGLRHKELPVISIQCHPEASPGPHDSRHIFSEFIDMMGKFKK